MSATPDFAANLPQINVFGRMVFDPVWAEQTHAAFSYEILHVISGHMELVIGDKSWPLAPGDTAVVPKGAMHRDEFDTERGLDILYCAFSWELADAYFDMVTNDKLLKMSADRRGQLMSMFDHLRVDPPLEGQAHRSLLRARVLAILMFLLRETEDVSLPPAQSAAQSIMQRARQYIHENYSQCIALNDIADAVGVSSYHLSHVFSQQSNFSLFGYLMQVRMDKAKELLRTGKYRVSEVSDAVGYQDSNYFSKVFRRQVGLSPSRYAANNPGS